MIISLCLPCKNRTYTLREALPTMIKAANASPPVEIVVVNYNSDDDLDDYMASVKTLRNPNKLIYKKYTGKRKYYHAAHARNLAMLAGTGEYRVSLGADILLHEEFVFYIRNYIDANHPIWMITKKAFAGVLICQAKEFIDAGGYDERFEFYGSQGEDLVLRLKRRGGKFGLLPLSLLRDIYTPYEEKIKNYNLRQFGNQKLLKRAMGKAMLAIKEENIANNILVANQGIAWGQYD